MKKEAQTLGVKVYSGFGSADDWKQVARQLKVQFVPSWLRSDCLPSHWGLQLGLIPIYVYWTSLDPDV